MILTGKAKEEFLISKEIDEFIFCIQDKSHQYSDIIEWLDSVGIIVEAMPTYYDGWTFLPIVYDNLGNKYDIDIDYESRQEATKQAIIKANEIYNKL